MLTREAHDAFNAVFRPMVEDILCHDPDEALLDQGVYFIRKGLWEGTEEHIYVYDRRKFPAYKETLVRLCKTLPKLHQPSEKHGGTISAFDLIVDTRKYPELNEEKKNFNYYMVLMANHFTNLLEGTGIAQIHPAVYGEHKTFLIVLHPKYRAYMNGESEEIPE